MPDTTSITSPDTAPGTTDASGTAVRFGVFLPTGQAQWGAGTDPRRLLDFAVLAERLGFDSLWVNDSLLNPRIEALTMLAAVAPLTERVTLGTAALLPVLRRPDPAVRRSGWAAPPRPRSAEPAASTTAGCRTRPIRPTTRAA